MYKGPEKPPEHLRGALFPLGDIDRDKASKAKSFSKKMSQGDIQQKRARLESLQGEELTVWRNQGNNETTYNALELLCYIWGRKMTHDGKGEELARMGTFGLLGFINRNELFDTNFADRSGDIKRIMTEHPTDTIRFFGNQAWADMKTSHPTTYDALARPTKLILDVMQVPADEGPGAKALGPASNKVDPESLASRRLLYAATALPYLLACSTYIEMELTQTAGMNADEFARRMAQKRQ